MLAKITFFLFRQYFFHQFFYLCKKINLTIMSKIFGTLMKTVYSVGNIPIDMKQKRLDPIKAQNKVLTKLLKKASNTAFGEYYNFNEILKSDNIFDTFRENIPIFDYNSMYKNWWFRALN